MSESAEQRCRHCGALVAAQPSESNGSRVCPSCGGQLVVAGSESEEEQGGTHGHSLDQTIDVVAQRHNVVAAEPTLDFSGSVTWLASGEDAPRKAGRDSVGRFKIRENLGRGGFGVVYRAFDPALDREVALKVPRLMSDDRHEIDRFLREAKAAARLRHPNIVAVFESGRAEQDYFIASEFVEGEPLSRRINKGLPPIQQSVSWVQQLAAALDYAHEEGVVHRDIKPSNVMIGKSGRPQIMDFGLAKRQDENDDVTLDGSVIGTPSYMSPEQARGELKSVGPVSDQYSLGAVLYHLLTGNKPYSGAPQSIVMQVSNVNEEPPRPRSINPRIPKDLEACCMKAMEKEPSHRYASSGDFAADLQRWLTGAPVQARPITNVEHLWRWCKRNRALASLLAIIAVIVLVFAASATVAAIRFRRLAERERIAANDAERTRVLEAAARRDAENALSDMYTNSGFVAAEEGDAAQAVLWFANAAHQAHNDPERQYANRIRLRNWSRQVPIPIAALPHDGQKLKQLKFHASGCYLLTRSEKPECRIWDVQTEQPHALTKEIRSAHSTVFSADGQWLAVGRDDRVELIGFPGGDERFEIPCNGPIISLAFSADDKRLAIGGHAARVWNCETKHFESVEFEHPAPVACVAFSAAGDRLVTACHDGKVRVFALNANDQSEPLFAPLPNPGPNAELTNPIEPVLIDGDRGLLTVTGRYEVAWWSADTGEQIRTIPAEQGVVNVIGSGDGKQFVICDFDHVFLWDAETAAPIGQPIRHKNFVYSAAFHPQGGSLLTVGADRKVGHWSTATANALTPAVYRQGEVNLVAYARDGDHFAGAQADGLVRVWRLQRKGSFMCSAGLEGYDNFIQLSSDGKYMTPSGWNFGPTLTSVQLFEVATCKPAGTAIKPAGMVNCVAISPDNRSLVTLSTMRADADQPAATSTPFSQPGQVEIWNRDKGTRICDSIETPSEPLSAAWSPGGRLVAVICGHGHVLVIDAATGKTVHAFEHDGVAHSGYVVRKWIRFAPDGESFVTWGMNDDLVRCWDTKTAALRWSVQHTRICHDVLFSPDGKQVVTTSMDESVGIWDAQNGKLLQSLPHPNWIFTAAFSRDGKLLLTACRDGMARLWDWRKGELACAEMNHDDAVFGVAFSHDERAVVTCCRDGSIEIWDRHHGKPLAHPVKLPSAVNEVAVTPDGEFAVFGGHLSALYVLRLPELIAPDAMRLDSERLQTLAELIAGQRVHEAGVKNLTSEEWLERWMSLDGKRADVLAAFR